MELVEPQVQQVLKEDPKVPKEMEVPLEHKVHKEPKGRPKVLKVHKVLAGRREDKELKEGLKEPQVREDHKELKVLPVL
jgi:hypothetical protein